MKKALPWLAAGLCVLLLAVIVFFAVRFTALVNQAAQKAEPSESVSVEEYFTNSWERFCPAIYDEEAGCVILQKKLDITYEQAYSFGKECYEEMALGHKDTLGIMLAGCRSATGVTLNDICINGISSDGEVVYSVHADGSISACWD